MRFICILLFLLSIQYTYGNDTIPVQVKTPLKSDTVTLQIKTPLRNDTVPLHVKNTLSWSGSILLLRGHSVNYERQLYNYSFMNFYVNTGFGGVFFFKPVYPTNYSRFTYLISSYAIPVSGVVLMGKKNHHFELNLGCYILFHTTAKLLTANGDRFSPDHNKYVMPIFNAGYRYQRPQGGFFMRAFTGVSGIGYGLGYAF
ncbi:MAG: hypothetical protein ACRCZB_09235 [Bacteroidales bacterium]